MHPSHTLLWSCVGVRSRRVTNDTDTYRSSSESDVSYSDVDRYVSFVIRQDQTPMCYKHSLTVYLYPAFSL
ncbi:hypothetical protein Y032_0044g990 [Ancylostoma ceylanicum]|uniref:Uncharacterized protein n=1 Tax=Ancylostoma ceylanicum TaxID=53326 RepID=A0A016UDN2_9BILA|nr:hypothetical protein Y032_0044g990 [Ancylostoma ceylanicum]